MPDMERIMLVWDQVNVMLERSTDRFVRMQGTEPWIVGGLVSRRGVNRIAQRGEGIKY